MQTGAESSATKSPPPQNLTGCRLAERGHGTRRLALAAPGARAERGKVHDALGHDETHRPRMRGSRLKNKTKTVFKHKITSRAVFFVYDERPPPRFLGISATGNKKPDAGRKGTAMHASASAARLRKGACASSASAVPPPLVLVLVLLLLLPPPRRSGAHTHTPRPATCTQGTPREAAPSCPNSEFRWPVPQRTAWTI